VRRIADGHLEERVQIRSGDEIQELAEAFNAMADTLQQTIGQLRAAYRELESLDQAKADLVANFSHELKTPLTALRGYVELLAEGGLGPLSPEAERAVSVCAKNVNRLARRIEELVQLSQLEKRTLPDLDRETVQIGQTLHGVVETLLPRIEEKQIVCSIDLAPDLETVSGSPEHLERAFLNLLDNAVKFTPDGGGIRVSAHVHAQDGRPGVLVRVADTGVGIPEGEQLRVFDRFYQVDHSARRRYGGMGLGLSLVRSTVEAHRGLVWVESHEGHGATFFVWLPSRPPDSGALRPARRHADSGTFPRSTVDPLAGEETS
jgi:signal transduction histidine kinase